MDGDRCGGGAALLQLVHSGLYPEVRSARESVTRCIGAAIVQTLASQGAKVAFNYVSESSKEAALKLVEEVERLVSTAVCVQCDVAAPTAPSTIVQAALAGLGTSHIDIIVNNAGLGGSTALEDVTVDEYERLMAVNVRAVLFVTHAALPHLRRGGRVVNLSLVSARGGYATQSVYAASKAAVEGLTRVWATELGHKYGITVNAVNPGPVDTDMYRAAGRVHLARMEAENKKVPAAPRCVTEEDVADIVLFLCEERSRQLRDAQKQVQLLKAAWRRFVPHIDLAQAVHTVETLTTPDSTLVQERFNHPAETQGLSQDNSSETTRTTIATASNVDIEGDKWDTLEWNEIRNLRISSDGIGSLTVDPKGSGYMQPQSGNALLRYLQSIANFFPNADEPHDGDQDQLGMQGLLTAREPPSSQMFAQSCIDWYFKHFHSA
ncbi:hypothetical protein LQW54_000186 [Pestalotiopsis sp. IQ-011]